MELTKQPQIQSRSTHFSVPPCKQQRTCPLRTLSLLLITTNKPRNRYAVSAPTYRYLYTGNFSNISPRPWEGAYHSSELPLVFGTSNVAHGQSTDFENALSAAMQDLYLAFISDPVDGLPARGWNAYETGGEAVEFGKGKTLVGKIGVDVLGSVCEGAVGIAGAGSPE